MWGAFKTCVILLVTASSAAGQYQEIPDDPQRGGADSVNWCDMKCGTVEHLACKLKVLSKYKVSNPLFSSECDVKSTLDPTERAAIVNLVNGLRNKIAENSVGFSKGATNLRLVKWDYKLERFADIMATNNIEQHAFIKKDYFPWFKDICAPTDDLKSTSAFINPKPSAKKLKIEDMFKEIDSLKPEESDINSLPDPSGPAPVPVTTEASGSRQGPIISFGNPLFYKYIYTMLASANASRIGCSYSEKICKSPGVTSPPFPIYDFYCFMGSGVNIVNEPVFKFGDACDCPAGTACNDKAHWPKLCLLNHGSNPDPTGSFKPIDNPPTTEGLAATIHQGTALALPLLTIAAQPYVHI